MGTTRSYFPNFIVPNGRAEQRHHNEEQRNIFRSKWVCDRNAQVWFRESVGVDAGGETKCLRRSSWLRRRWIVRIFRSSIVSKSVAFDICWLKPQTGSAADVKLTELNLIKSATKALSFESIECSQRINGNAEWNKISYFVVIYLYTQRDSRTDIFKSKQTSIVRSLSLLFTMGWKNRTNEYRSASIGRSCFFRTVRPGHAQVVRRCRKRVIVWEPIVGWMNVRQTQANGLRLGTIVRCLCSAGWLEALTLSNFRIIIGLLGLHVTSTAGLSARPFLAQHIPFRVGAECPIIVSVMRQIQMNQTIPPMT